MKAETRYGTRNRFVRRRARVMLFRDTSGKRFVAISSGNGELIMPAHPTNLRPTVSLLPATSKQTSFPVYSSADIQKLGGIDAFSKAIGNTEPIQVPSIEFTEAEWNSMLGNQPVQE